MLEPPLVFDGDDRAKIFNRSLDLSLTDLDEPCAERVFVLFSRRGDKDAVRKLVELDGICLLFEIGNSGVRVADHRGQTPELQFDLRIRQFRNRLDDPGDFAVESYASDFEKEVFVTPRKFGEQILQILAPFIITRKFLWSLSRDGLRRGRDRAQVFF